jgi:hypothetical protein
MRASWVQSRFDALQKSGWASVWVVLFLVAACETKAQVINKRTPPGPSVTTDNTGREPVSSSALSEASSSDESPSFGATSDLPTTLPSADAGINQSGAPDASKAADGGDTSNAPIDSSCQARCAAAGGVCVPSGNQADDKCVFECGDGACLAGITCPDELHCEVTCGVGACAGPVTCSSERNCSVACEGNDSCAGGVDCASSLNCGVDCFGANSCQGQIHGGANSNNNVNCNGAGSCSGGIDCDADNCTANCNGNGSCAGVITANSVFSTVNCTNGSCTDVRCQANTCSANCSGASCDTVTCSATNCNINCDEQSCAVVNCSSTTCR